MREELIIKTRTLVGVSDLTIAAPIKPGLVPSLEAVTYKSRAKAVLRVLNGSRSSLHEYSLLRAFSDSVERVGHIHSVRIAVIDDKVMLAATYDGNFEAYLRVLYTKVSRLLDLIFCNTIGHVGAHACSYEQWRDWVAGVQVETDMFYSTPGLTYDDGQYLQNQERDRRTQAQTALQATEQRIRSAEQRADAAVRSGPQCPVRPEHGSPALRPAGQLEMLKQGIQSLAVLYRLADLYLPATPDGDYLQRAAQDLLPDLKRFARRELQPDDNSMDPVRQRFAKQLVWLAGTTPAPDATVSPTPSSPDDAQGGILSPYPDGITHGALVLLRCASPAGANALLAWLQRQPQLWRHGDTAIAASHPIVTVGFTAEGLRAAGLDEAEQARLPLEFREGMEARSSVLGDLHINHPRRWRLPLRNWPAPQTQRIEMAAVHAVVQLRISAPDATEFDHVHLATHPLHATVHTLAKAHAHLQVLSVEAMRNAHPLRSSDLENRAREHFGFADPVSNPVFSAPAQTPRYYGHALPIGEALLGHATQADAAPMQVDALLHNGSFMVIRKLRQDVPRFNAVTARAAQAAQTAGATITADEVKAKLLGRGLDGAPLVVATGPGGSNDFNYAADPLGHACPFQAHARRANPRGDGASPTANGLPRPPVIVRRGMSYGSPHVEGEAPTERGLYFMAYNASIAEQFELIQRWLAGGNSSGISSGQSDPICGVPRPGDARTARFSHNGQVIHVPLDDPLTGTAHPDVPKPLVQLEWGLYLFVPAITALKALGIRAHRQAERAANASASRPSPLQPVPWNAGEGARLLAEIQAQVQGLPGDAAAQVWKAALEDPEARRLHRSAAIWAAVRELHGGVLHTLTPYGVLVGSPERVREVFTDADGRYSMRGHLARMRDCFGEIYLGLDRDSLRPGCEYERLSKKTNEAIQALAPAASYAGAYEATHAVLARYLVGTIEQARAFQLPEWELSLDMKELSDGVLAALCNAWFGLPGAPGTTPFSSGGYRWDWKEGEPPLIPGHLTWPSRYIFQPLPGRSVEDFGQGYGQALREAALTFVQRHRDAHGATPPPQPLSKAIFEAFPDRSDDDLVARTLVGTLMGFLPTVDGNLRATLNEWLRDGSFWRLGHALGERQVSYSEAWKALGQALRETLQLRPMPELVWRTAIKAHALGGAAVQAGDRVVVAIVSATQRHLETGAHDVTAVFGGQRSAPGAPTHACPGMDAGLAVLLGTLAALLQAPKSLAAALQTPPDQAVPPDLPPSPRLQKAALQGPIQMRPSPVPLSLVFTGRASGTPPP